MSEFDENASLPVRYAADGAVGRLTLTAPERRNAFTPRSLRVLLDGLEEAQADPDVRVVVLDAEGPAFCAGADFETAADPDLPRLYAMLLGELRDATKPVVARVQGPVVGGGNGLVASADVAIASTAATFAFTEVRIGAVPAVVAVPCLRKMRRADLQELMLTGERFDAERARSTGLVQRVVPPEELDAAVDGAVAALCQGSPTAIAVTRQILRDVPTMEEDEALAWAASISAEMFASADAEEGRSAFAARRSPEWIPEDFRLH